MQLQLMYHGQGAPVKANPAERSRLAPTWVTLKRTTAHATANAALLRAGSECGVGFPEWVAASQVCFLALPLFELLDTRIAEAHETRVGVCRRGIARQ